MANIQDKKNKLNQAFTLAEFLVVIAILVILAGITIIFFKNFQPDYQLNGATRNLITNLRYTQQLALTEQIKYCLKIFLPEKKYQVIPCDAGQPVLEVSLVEEIKSISTSGFINNKIEFNPYGAAKASGQVILENINGKTKTIEVRPSGFVKTIE